MPKKGGANMSKFAERISELINRYDGNLTQYARRIDVSINQLYSYRSGTAEASFDVLLRISEIEDVSVDWLLGSNFKQNKNFTDEEISLLKNYNVLTDEAKNELLNYSNYLLTKNENKKKVISVS